MGYKEHYLFGEPGASSTGYFDADDDSPLPDPLSLEEVAREAVSNGLILPLRLRIVMLMQYLKPLEQQAKVCHCRQCVGHYIQTKLRMLELGWGGVVPNNVLDTLQQERKRLIR